MIGHYLLALITLAVIFILFLVISRTLNSTITLLIKIEYSLQREFDLKQEALEVRRLMEEEVQKEQAMENPQKELR